MSTMTMPPQSTAPKKRTRRPRRILRILGAILLTLVLLAVAGWAWTTRPQGQAAAVEFSQATLSPTLTNATVLALGEATHGNAEFHHLRRELTQKAVNADFRTVVLEEDHGHTREVDEFVQGGPGTAVEAAKRFGFRVSKTTETAQWLQWLRDHNASVPPAQRISLIGMDAQFTDASLGHLAQALATSDPKAAALAKKLAPEDRVLKPAELTALKKAVASMPTASRKEAEEAVDALEDNARIEAGRAQDPSARDRVMFDILKAIVAEHGKTILLGHNGHLAKTANGVLTEPVGVQAAREWGDDYRVIGTEVHHTRFDSGTRTERKEWSVTNRTPLRGMFEGTKVGYLEFATATGDNRALVDSQVGMSSIGEGFTWIQWVVPFTRTVYLVPSQAYDALILVDDAHPTTML